MQHLLDQWEKFKVVIKENPLIRPSTAEAWERCRQLGLTPDELHFSCLSDSELKNILKENSRLIKIAHPYLEHLSKSLAGIPHIVALADKGGWIIDMEGPADELGGRSAGLCIGASWSEESIGNNGGGTALVLGEPVFIYGKEHFGTAYGSCACLGVPIRNNGHIIGALDISVPNEYGHPSRLHLAVACVNSIETTLSNNSDSSFDNASKVSTTSELIASAVHDLKNPLSVIRGLGELGMLTSDKDTSKYFEKVIKQTDKLNNMVLELLNIFKPEEYVVKNICPIISELLITYETECKFRNISLSFCNGGDRLVKMRENLFKRALDNLVINALQSMKEGELVISTKVDDDFIITSIRDTAGGIPEEIKDSLFQPFMYRRIGGTGLGLFMVYNTITNVHNGDVYFETVEGEGTTFFIKLPVYNFNDTNL